MQSTLPDESFEALDYLEVSGELHPMFLPKAGAPAVEPSGDNQKWVLKTDAEIWAFRPLIDALKENDHNRERGSLDEISRLRTVALYRGYVIEVNGHRRICDFVKEGEYYGIVAMNGTTMVEVHDSIGCGDVTSGMIAVTNSPVYVQDLW